MSADERADQIRARLTSATPGPWVASQMEGPEVTEYLPVVLDAVDTELIASCGYGEDADLIANAPADLAWLMAERDELLRRVEQAERAGAVKALESESAWMQESGPACGYGCDNVARSHLDERVDALRNGADL